MSRMDFEEPLRSETDAGFPWPPSAGANLQPIAALRPTQITAGWREVEAKRIRRQLNSREDARVDVIPVILGPGKHAYLRDRHHLVLALHRAGIDTVGVAYVDDLSHLDTASFWAVLEERRWVHPYDKNRNRRDFAQMPVSVLQLEDDPFRSLAGELRREGGFVKSNVAYAEFAWADFMRGRIAGDLIGEDFDAALEVALVLARSDEARQLPGWCGTIENPARRAGDIRAQDRSLREAV
jgi:hypothetical protein